MNQLSLPLISKPKEPLFHKSLEELIAGNNLLIRPTKQPPLVLETFEKLNKDKEPVIMTRTIKLGRYLKKQFPDLSEAVIKNYVEGFIRINKDLSRYSIQTSTDYETIYTIPMYSLSSHHLSCMTNEDCVRVYSYDNRLSLLLVYFEDKLAARTLVRSDTKEYVRIYLDRNFIDDNAAIALIESLYKQGDLEGIMLDRIECEEGLVCPYLDGLSNVSDCGDHLLITSDGELEATETNGYIAIGKTCCCCSAGGLSDDEVRCNDDGDIYCEYCYYETYTYCEYEEIEVYIDDAIYIDDCNLPQLSKLHGEGYYTKEFIENNIFQYL